ncbi:PREDICTED: splicing factor 45 [Nicrophorus vespilloides]|uniref:Splicing factor 45 n=1 Tax=Nicrophorus vespilloides TaxID=110193 RepID=A0ABM1NAF5_NICVS|nr:PREDICTED: splicing factor 45 [Nicrophorus vespilloides]
MSLYDDLDVKTRTTENVSGWSSGIKLLQSQLQLKKAAVTQPKRDVQKRVSLPPVIDLKTKRDEEDIYGISKPEPVLPVILPPSNLKNDLDWNVIDEYDPLWPNEYEKIVKEIRDNRDRDRDRDREYEKEEKRRERDRRKKSRFNDPEDASPSSTPQVSLPPNPSGFAGRWEDEEEHLEPSPKPSRSGGGVAIAPPPSLQEPAEQGPSTPNRTPPPGPSQLSPQPATSYGGGSVAAKIMAKYGFKEGQGLGKQEQGMSVALQVEKTSKRGGRIIHEKEMMMPPPPPQKSPEEPTITEIMKTPSKVVLLRNMVGPGEVDDDLEPEVKDECNTKYGDVGSVVIHELQDQLPEDAVRIFVEFNRIESAIKAVVDLNGRFFGGRQVKATFYDTEKFDNFQLLE